MNSILKQCETFVTELLTNKLADGITYHNLQHTKRVVDSAKLICNNENVSEDYIETILLAAWFHDTGFINSYDNHEEESCKIAESFLTKNNYPNDKIAIIKETILATKKDVEPKNIFEFILVDADHSHIAEEEYFVICKPLRQEWGNLNIKSFTDIEWIQENIDYLVKYHKYYTDFAIYNWNSKKSLNLKRLEATVEELKAENTENKTSEIVSTKKKTVTQKPQLKKEDTASLTVETTLKNKKKKKKKKNDFPEKGIETMFRVTLRNHIKLSDIADTKANILLSVNAIIISLALSSLIPKLDNPSNQHLIYPTIVLIFFSLVSIIFAILSTRPNVTSGKFTRKEIEDKKVNLLFFGNFHKMPLLDYQWAMNELMKDREYLYNSLIKDLYFLGIVLNRKYKLLRITYTIFMIGIIASVLAFWWAFQTINI